MFNVIMFKCQFSLIEFRIIEKSSGFLSEEQKLLFENCSVQFILTEVRVLGHLGQYLGNLGQ